MDKKTTKNKPADPGPVPQQQQQKLSDLKCHELGTALNNSHNRIHQANNIIMVEQNNINSIMAEIQKRSKDGE